MQSNNEVNAASTPGSVKGDGGTAADFISFDDFEQNKGNQSWVKELQADHGEPPKMVIRKEDDK